MHSLKKIQGRKGYMVIKIDLEKAYDRMNWSFIKKILEEIGFDDHLK